MARAHRRVLYLYEFLGLGGVETATLNKISALERVGIEGWAYFARFYGDGARDLASHPRVMVGVQPEETTAALLRQGWDAISIIDYQAMLELVDRNPVEAPVIFENHASKPLWQPEWVAELVRRRVATITVPSTYNARLVSERLGDDPPVVIAPNAIDTDTFTPDGPAEPPFALLGAGQHPVLWIGRLEDEKNPQELIEIANRLVAGGVPAHFVVVGDAPGVYESYRAGLEAGLEPRTRPSVEFVRTLRHDDMAQVYRWVARHGGVLLSTSWFESFPMTFLEAMASGCAVVSSDVGGVRDAIDDGVTGCLYEAGDPAAAVNLLGGLLKGDAEAARELGSRARAAVVGRHGLRAAGEWHSRLLEGVSKPGGGPELASAVSAPASTGADVVPGLVSTIIPVHNRAEMLRQAVASVQAQTYRPIEIIIVDDGSTDHTEQVCEDLARADPAVRVIRTPHQGRVGLVREAGRRAARGEFIQYLDSDDLLMPTKFEELVRLLLAHPDCDIVYSGTRRYTAGEQPSDVATERTGEAFDRMFPTFLAQRFWHTSSPLYRRRITDRAGSWSDLRVWEDIEYDTRMGSLQARLCHVGEILTDFRDHAGERMSGADWLDDPVMVDETVRAYSMIAAHARAAGLTCATGELRDLVDDLNVLAVLCERRGLERALESIHEVVADLCPDRVAGLTVLPLLAAKLDCTSTAVIGRPGETVSVAVGVANESAISFRNGIVGLGLSYHLLDESGTAIAWDNERVPFVPPLASGERRTINVPVTLPEATGSYQVQFDLVLEHIAWLSQLGVPTASVSVRVVDAHSRVQAGDDRPSQAGNSAGERVQGLVSTVIPVYNRSRLLGEAVESVLAQTYRPIEIIVVDDGSTDETPAVCDEMAAAHPEVRVVHLEHVGRVGLVREAGRRAARGEFIQYLDSDDLIDPRKFEVMVAALRDRPDCDVAYCPTRVYEVGEHPRDEPTERTGEGLAAMLPSFISQRYWRTPTPLYTRRITDLTGPWSDLMAWEDFEYEVRMATHDPQLVHCPQLLADVRNHPGTRLSQRSWEEDPELLAEAFRAHRLVYDHARKWGVATDAPDMLELLEDMRYIARHCHAMRLTACTQQWAEIVSQVTGGGDELPLPRLGATMSTAPESLAARPGEVLVLPVRIRNDSAVALRRAAFREFSLSHHLLAEDGSALEWERPRNYFGPPLAPGDEQIIELAVTAPQPGGYLVEIDIVWEAIAWFKDVGNPTLRLPLTVTSDHPVAHGPLVSVVIPIRDQAEFLPEAIESILGQSYANWECIVVDDGSVDETPDVARALVQADPRISYHHQPNQGLASARNAGLARASGRYVQFLDADDLISTDKLALQVAELEAAPDFDVSYASFWRFDAATGQRIDQAPLELGADPLADLLLLWERGLTIPIHAALFRRGLWPDAVAFDEQMGAKEDWVMWVDLASRGVRFKRLAAGLAWYRIHEHNMAGDRAAMLGEFARATRVLAGRIPAKYRPPFIYESRRYLSELGAQYLADLGLPEPGMPPTDLVDGLIMQLHKLLQQGAPDDAISAIADEIRLAALACMNAGADDALTACRQALSSLPDHLVTGLGPARLAAVIEPLTVEVQAAPGRRLRLPVRVINRSDVTLRGGPYFPSQLSYHLLRSDGEPVTWDNPRLPFTTPLAPGGERVMVLDVSAPLETGRFLIEIDIVCERVGWFAATGSSPAQVALHVEDEPISSGSGATPADISRAQASPS